jgi:hypothetical protein
METIAAWRLARDIRAYVTDIRDLVHGEGLQIIDGAQADEELKWALAYAERIDPLTAWREDIERAKTQIAGAPCPDCGKIHGADEAPVVAEGCLHPTGELPRPKDLPPSDPRDLGAHWYTPRPDPV